MEQQNEVDDLEEYEEDGAEEGEGGDGVCNGEGGEGRERRRGGRFILRNLIRLLDRFTPSLIKKRKRRVKGVHSLVSV